MAISIQNLSQEMKIKNGVSLTAFGYSFGARKYPLRWGGNDDLGVGVYWGSELTREFVGLLGSYPGKVGSLYLLEDPELLIW